jgi:hypothetical protein
MLQTTTTSTPASAGQTTGKNIGMMLLFPATKALLLADGQRRR